MKDSAVVLEEESASEAVFSSEVDNGPIRFEVLLELHGKVSVWKKKQKIISMKIRENAECRISRIIEII